MCRECVLRGMGCWNFGVSCVGWYVDTLRGVLRGDGGQGMRVRCLNGEQG